MSTVVQNKMKTADIPLHFGHDLTRGAAHLQHSALQYEHLRSGLFILYGDVNSTSLFELLHNR
jgi:hypothetical protein